MELERRASIAALVGSGSSLRSTTAVAPAGGDVKRRGRRGPGVPIIPSRIRQARTERGMSLADLAGAEVSRAFIHQLEQGLARPSLQILELIAQRTGKSVSFFTNSDLLPSAGPDLPSEMVATSKRLERLAGSLELSESHREAFRMVINNLRHGARLITAVTQERRPRRAGAPAPETASGDDVEDVREQRPLGSPVEVETR
jgi:transcriptional regulator with XRE-family HTH domain